MNEINNNKVNLCDSCSQVYPDCTSKPENVYFGDGAGHDNICACSEYRPSAQPQPLIDQLRWERDVAVRQLHDLGYEFGEEPSAQPETHEKRTETHARDCVSGVAAIIAAIEAVDEWDGGYNVQRANMIRDAIKALPSEQPQRIKGRWIDRGKDRVLRWECSNCGRRDNHIYNYCPFCGANMKGEEDAAD